MRSDLPLGYSILGAVFVLGLCATPVFAAFTTIINAPPVTRDEFNSIRSDTQLNIHDGASLPGGIYVGEFFGDVDNVEINVFGGTIDGYVTLGSRFHANTDVVANIFGGTIAGSVVANSGSVLNMSGGAIDWSISAIGSTANISGGLIGWGVGTSSGGTLNISGGSIDGNVGADENSVVNFSGGYVGRELVVRNGSTANISGGTIGYYLGVGEGSTVNVSGGNLGEVVSVSSGGRINVYGGEYRLDGAPIDRLQPLDSELALDLSSESLLTGTLIDGTPFAFSKLDWDQISDGALTLHTAAVPTATPAVFHAPSESVPKGLRAGQTLIASEGANVGNHFNASWGSVVNLTGGRIGNNFEATGAIVNISGGSVGELADAFLGTVVNLSGGSIDSNFYAGSGSVVNISGGTVGLLFEADAGSVVNFSGGAIGDYVKAFAASQFKITGRDFRLDGVPITGLSTPGNTRAINIPSGAVFSGALADGRPFAFAGDDYDYFADGTITLELAELSPAEPVVYRVPSDPSPVGLRNGQMLILADGGAVGDHFNADWGSIVSITGGRVGSYFEAVGAVVNVSGGEVEWGFDAFYGSVVNISGGIFGVGFNANRGSVVNISGGSFLRHLQARSGSVVNIAGGSIGDYTYGHSGSVINMTGGTIGNGFVLYGGSMNMSGGTIGDEFHSGDGGNVSISGGVIGDRVAIYGGYAKLAGSDFRIDGTLIDGLDALGAEVALDVPEGSVLSGTLSDGTPFAFSTQDDDYLAEGTLRLQAWAAPAPEAAAIHVPTSPSPTGVRSGQALVVSVGGTVPNNFNAGWGSVVTVAGGTIGDNFEATGSLVTIAGSEVGSRFDAFHGSVVNVLGGAIGNEFGAHRGSIVNVVGGDFGYGFRANEGSVVNVLNGSIDDHFVATGALVNLSGGEVGDFSSARDGAIINLSGGSIGYGFAATGAVVNISGGEVGERFSASSGTVVTLAGGGIGRYFHAYPDTEVQLVGSTFYLDGVEIEGLIPGDPLKIDPRDMILSGLFADGSEFRFEFGSTTYLSPDYLDPAARLTVTLVLAGDYNGNGVVDAADYSVWRDSFGSTTKLAADGNFDGVVDRADYDVWKIAFATAGGSGVYLSASNAPEPTTAAYLLVVFAGQVLCRRCRRRTSVAI